MAFLDYVNEICNEICDVIATNVNRFYPGTISPRRKASHHKTAPLCKIFLYDFYIISLLRYKFLYDAILQHFLESKVFICSNNEKMYAYLIYYIINMVYLVGISNTRYMRHNKVNTVRYPCDLIWLIYTMSKQTRLIKDYSQK